MKWNIKRGMHYAMATWSWTGILRFLVRSSKDILTSSTLLWLFLTPQEQDWTPFPLNQKLTSLTWKKWRCVAQCGGQTLVLLLKSFATPIYVCWNRKLSKAGHLGPVNLCITHIKPLQLNAFTVCKTFKGLKRKLCVIAVWRLWEEAVDRNDSENFSSICAVWTASCGINRYHLGVLFSIPHSTSALYLFRYNHSISNFNPGFLWITSYCIYIYKCSAKSVEVRLVWFCLPPTVSNSFLWYTQW